MASPVVFKQSCLVLALAVLGVWEAEAAVTCNQVVNYMTPCVSYMVGGGSVPAACCRGVRTLYGLAQTTADRQNVCQCLKTALHGLAYNIGLASGLPSQCGLNIPYKISPSTDCKSVK